MALRGFLFHANLIYPAQVDRHHQQGAGRKA
jgi:hypothetical protein